MKRSRFWACHGEDLEATHTVSNLPHLSGSTKPCIVHGSFSSFFSTVYLISSWFAEWFSSQKSLHRAAAPVGGAHLGVAEVYPTIGCHFSKWNSMCTSTKSASIQSYCIPDRSIPSSRFLSRPSSFAKIDVSQNWECPTPLVSPFKDFKDTTMFLLNGKFQKPPALR